MTAITTPRELRAAQRARQRLWKDNYRSYARSYLRALEPGEAFTGEDLRKHLEPHIGAPEHHNSWGGMAAMVVRDWLDHGEIYQAGTRAMTARKANGRRTPLYRKPEIGGNPKPEGFWARLLRKLVG
jgi:hypothetical protein